MTVINVDRFDVKNHKCIDGIYLQQHNIQIGQLYWFDIHKNNNNTCLENMIKMIYDKYNGSITEKHNIEFSVDEITTSKCIKPLVISNVPFEVTQGSDAGNEMVIEQQSCSDLNFQRYKSNKTDTIVSTITSLNITDISYFFTEFTNDDYKYKSFTDKNINIISLMPYVHVNFSSSHIYGYVNNTNIHANNYILNVNILKNKSKNAIMYNEVTLCSNHSIECKPILCETIVTEDMINYEFFNALLYNSYKDGYNYMDVIKHRNSIWVTNIDTKIHTLQNLTHELDNIKSDKIWFNNRFLQRFHIQDFIHPTFMKHFFNTNTNLSIINTTKDYESMFNLDITDNNLHVVHAMIDRVTDSYNIDIKNCSISSIVHAGSTPNLNDKISHEHDCDIIIYYLLDGKSIEFEFYDKTKICLMPSSILFLSGYLKHGYIPHSSYELLCIKVKV